MMANITNWAVEILNGHLLVVIAKALYFAYVEERDMVDCFLAFQDARFSPRKMQNLVMDLLESGQEARSTSEKAFG